MSLDPQARNLLDLVAASGRPPWEQLPVAEARADYLGRRHVVQPPPPDVARVDELTIASGRHELAARHYRPVGTADADVLPALVYFHGGGWTIGGLDSHDTLCRSLANGAGCAVVSVDYRLGPENRFPAAVADALAAFDRIAGGAADFTIDPGRIAVGGDSAGGNLAAVVALACRDRGGPRPMFQLLIYPATDMRLSHDSHRRNGDGYLLTASLVEWFRGQYIDDPRHYLDWRASPLLATRHDGLPPALMLTAGYDPLVDEGDEYADRLAASGVPVERVRFDRQIHGFITMGRMLDDAGVAIERCSRALRQAFAGRR